jgi:hypothetical protein
MLAETEKARSEWSIRGHAGVLLLEICASEVKEHE